MTGDDLVTFTARDTDLVAQVRAPRLLDPLVVERLIADLRAALDAQPQGRLVLDLTAVRHLSSSFLGQLVLLRRDLDETGRDALIVGARETLLHLFKVTGLKRLFRFGDRLAEGAA